jgi:hypothetical protein
MIRAALSRRWACSTRSGARQMMPEPRRSRGEVIRVPVRSAHASTGAWSARRCASIRSMPTSSSSPTETLNPAKSWYGSVISSKRRASARRVSSYRVSRVRSSVPSKASHPVIAGLKASMSPRRT